MSTEELAVQDAVVGRVRVGRPLSRRGDAALVRAAQGGSAEAVEELFRRHWPAVHRSAWLVVHDAAAAEDIAQEAFVSALRALDRFDRRRPLAPWLHRIVVNRAIDWSRARALRPETGADTLPEPAAPEPPTEIGDELVAALADLGPEHRAVVVLRHLLGYTPGEIATMLDLPRGTVNSRLRRALDALSLALEEDAMTRARDGLDARAAAGGRDDARRARALERALREAEPPDAGPARERARRTVLAAHAATTTRRRARRAVPLVWAALAAVLAALFVTQRDSGPAQAVERLVRDIVREPKATPTPVAAERVRAPGRRAAAGQRRRRPLRRQPQRPADRARRLRGRDLVAARAVRRRDQRRARSPR